MAGKSLSGIRYVLHHSFRRGAVSVARGPARRAPWLFLLAGLVALPVLLSGRKAAVASFTPFDWPESFEAADRLTVVAASVLLGMLIGGAVTSLLARPEGSRWRRGEASRDRPSRHVAPRWGRAGSGFAEVAACRSLVREEG